MKEVVFNITCLCSSLICLIQSNLLRTSDYVDALECNTLPIKDSQYWVIGFVNLYMARNFPAINEDLYDFVTRNNINGMKFDSGVID